MRKKGMCLNPRMIELDPIKWNFLLEELQKEKPLDSDDFYHSYADIIQLSDKILEMKFDTKKHFEKPEILVSERTKTGLEFRYNDAITKNINEKISRYKEAGGERNGRTEVADILSNRRKITELMRKQVSRSLYNSQIEFIKTSNPLALGSKELKEVASELNNTINCVYRSLAGLTIQTPEGEVFFAKDLMCEERKIDGRKANYLLHSLSQNPDYYDQEKREWKVESPAITEYLSGYGLNVEMQTARNYMNRIGKSQFNSKREIRNLKYDFNA